MNATNDSCLPAAETIKRNQRCARVLAGRRVTVSLPARTRTYRSFPYRALKRTAKFRRRSAAEEERAKDHRFCQPSATPGGLQLKELRIASLGRKQFLMRSQLRYTSIGDHGDAVGDSHC